MKSDFIVRTISAFFILLFMLALVFINNYVLLAGILFLSVLSIYELGLAFDKIGFKLISLPAYTFNVVLIVLTYFYRNQYLLPLISIYIIVLLVSMIFSDSIEIQSVMLNSFIAIYITLSYSFFIIIRDSNWLLYLFGISSLTDTFAYLVGMTMGKHKLIEKLSPKKTVEGFIGGIIGALIFSIVFKYFTKVEISYPILLIVSLILSIISQLGDLIASYIKRKANIKDYGYIFKGHGGVMDRFDSILLIAPIIAFIVQYV